MSKVSNECPINYDDPEFRITPVQQAAASCTGAVVTSLFVTPLDVVKIRLQAQQTIGSSAFKRNKCFLYCNGLMDHLCSCGPEDPNRWYQRPGQFNGTMDAFVKITRTEGITSLWSGLSPTLVLAIPATIVYFVTYEQLRLKLKDMYNKKKPPEAVNKQPYWIPLISGATARVFSASIVSPIELVRTKMQSRKLSYLELQEALQILIKQDGIKGLWKGVFPTLLRDVPFSAVYWMHYEAIKRFFAGPDATPSFWLSFMAGAVSGSVAAVVTVPFDVVKTHQQIEFGETVLSNDGSGRSSRTTMQIMRQVFNEHGVKGLFAGTVPRLIKVAPACALMISSFEYGKVFFNRLANRELGGQVAVGKPASTLPHTVPISKVDQFADNKIISTSNNSSQEIV